MAYRIANGIWGALFVVAALLQVNDPDPFRWMFVYGFAALFCALALRGEVPERPALGYAVVAALLALSTWLSWSGESEPMGGPAALGVFNEEVVREALGLGLISFWMAVLAIWTRLNRLAEEQ